MSSDSKNGAGVKQPIMLTASGGACRILDNDHLIIDYATDPTRTGFTCVVTIHQAGNEIFDQVTQNQDHRHQQGGFRRLSSAPPRPTSPMGTTRSR